MCVSDAGAVADLARSNHLYHWEEMIDCSSHTERTSPSRFNVYMSVVAVQSIQDAE
jgi:hypothetical protein